MSVAELIESATTRLKRAGVTKPRREANRLWAWLNRVSLGDAYLDRERGADQTVAQEFERAVDRRLAGEPLAYVLGHVGFRTLEIRCDHRALIPRPESEGIIDHALRLVRTGRALDLGAGTGCLALSLATEGAFSRIVGVDLSPDALDLARENGALLAPRVEWVRSDFGRELATAGFDLIVSNPPYLTEAEYQNLDPAVKQWEPRLALASGADGLEATRRVLQESSRLLTSSGTLVMELDCTRSELVAELARATGFTGVSLWDDLFGRPRYLTARREPQG